MNRARLPLLGSLVLAAGVLIVFLPTLRNGYVWDDTQYVLSNAHVTGGLSPENLRWAVTAFEAGNWHPLTWVSHMADAELFGRAPWGQHLVNVLLHLGSTLLLFALLLRLTGAAGKSFLAAALFGVHPLRVESVAWIAERKDVLATFLGLLATLAYSRYARSPGRLRYLAVTLLFAAGLAAKQMLVTLPVLLLLLDFWPLGRLSAASWRRPLLEKLPWLALAAAGGSLTLRAQASAGAFSAYPFAARAANAAVSYLRYIQKTVTPVDLAVFYPHPQQAYPLAATLGAAAVLGAASVLVVAGRRRRPWLATGWLWFLAALTPVIGLVQVGEQALADRYSYLPGIGLLIVGVWGLGGLAGARRVPKPALAAVAAGLLLACAALSLKQIGYWRDDVTLFSHAAQVAPGNWTAHFQLGAHYQRLGRDAEAIEQYRAAIAARSGFSEALNNLGMLYARQGDPAQAEAWYRAAIGADVRNMEAYNNLGGNLMQQGRYREAEACFLRALGLRPGAAEPRLNLELLRLRELPPGRSPPPPPDAAAPPPPPRGQAAPARPPR